MCTAPYRAPELFDVPSKCTIDERVDVWSLGEPWFILIRSPALPCLQVNTMGSGCCAGLRVCSLLVSAPTAAS